MQGSPVAKRPRAVEIKVSPEGIAIIWRAAEQPALVGRRTKVSQQTMSLIRALYDDGETYATIAAVSGTSRHIVIDVIKGRYALTPNKYNTRSAQNACAAIV